MYLKYFCRVNRTFECKHDKTQIECFFLEKDLKSGKMPRGLSEINTFACCDYILFIFLFFILFFYFLFFSRHPLTTVIYNIEVATLHLGSVLLETIYYVINIITRDNLFISHCILYLPCKFNYICRNLKITIVCTRNRPEIRLNPAPAGFPASKSGSGSGSGWKKICRIFAGFQFFLPKKKSKKHLHFG